MKTILYFYPENPLLLTQGNNSRANTLLQYFRNRNFIVDFIGEHKEFFNENDLELLQSKKLIRNGWLLKKTIRNSFHFIFNLGPKKIFKGFLKILYPSLYYSINDLNKTKKGYVETFNDIIKDNHYDYIIISYSNWSKLITNAAKLAPKSKLIIDTHDFITAQHQDKKHFDIGYYFKNEINCMKLFDSIWAISTEEHFLFSQFLSEKNVVLIPHGSIENFDNKKTNPEIDLLYVASDNPHNISSINWFFKEVYPILDKSIKITVIGKICNSIATYPNVTMVKYAESLSEYYENTKISLCPMLSGTGLKIKVVEALSYGIPVVCNQRGLDGLQNKIGNGCLSTESAVVFSEHISELINNREFYVKTSNHAKSFFQNTLSEKVVFDKLDQEFHIE